MRKILADLNASELASLVQATGRSLDRISKASLSDDDRHGMWCDSAELRAWACEAARKVS